jgi:hypothetical protein
MGHKNASARHGLAYTLSDSMTACGALGQPLKQVASPIQSVMESHPFETLRRRKSSQVTSGSNITSIWQDIPDASPSLASESTTLPGDTTCTSTSSVNSSCLGHPDGGSLIRKSGDTQMSTPAAPTQLSTCKSSSSKSGGRNSGTDTLTVTSEGFTDYLSDESDQELQKQAEIKAAELAIAQQEKAEFDAALHSVRHLCLQPPPEWNHQFSIHRGSKISGSSHIGTFQSTTVLPITVGHLRS